MSQQTARQVDADTLASQHKLGTWRQTFELNKVALCIVVLILILLIFFGVPISCSLLAEHPKFTLPLSLNLNTLVPLLVLCVILLVIIGLVVSWIKAAYRRGSALLLYTNGLILLQYQRKRLVFSDVLHWQDVVVIWHKIERPVDQHGDERSVPKHTFRIQNKQGAMFGGDSFEFDMAKLGNIVEKETIPYLWPSTLDTYQRGLLVTFGPIDISSTGIYYDGQILPWQMVKEVRCGARVTIKQQSDSIFSSWARVPSGDVPNLWLLYTLFSFIHDQQGPAAFILKNKG